MLFVLSPAKTLDLESTVPYSCSTPSYLSDSQNLVAILQKKSVSEIRSLMHMSEKLARLNHHRFQNWKPSVTEHVRPAIYCFKGDVYKGLKAEQFNQQHIDFAQQHLRILSGLYGLLKPLDAIAAHRLEMGTKLPNPRGEDLYDFWRDKLTQEVSKQLQKIQTKIFVNLASKEYSKSLNLKQLPAKIITPVFEDEKNGVYKIISFFAKKARGLMGNYIIKNQLTEAHELKEFCEEGYRFVGEENSSGETRIIFQRCLDSATQPGT